MEVNENKAGSENFARSIECRPDHSIKMRRVLQLQFRRVK